ncbi:Conserved_hypothetical protein [Hexamita inflata]|uniref:Uncharacterized protein n=1 Tax=Hexamita inflata TaxID=28002 RepID=A0AA86U971_9EUKA|nr:Conserved hypothetical protein [Hexamita inflata]
MADSSNLLLLQNKLLLSKDEINAATLLCGMDASLVNRYLKKLQQVIELQTQAKHQFSIREQSINFIKQFIKTGAVQKANLVEKLHLLRHSTFALVHILKSIRQILTYPCEFNLEVQASSFLSYILSEQIFKPLDIALVFQQTILQSKSVEQISILFPQITQQQSDLTFQFIFNSGIEDFAQFWLRINYTDPLVSTHEVIALRQKEILDQKIFESQKLMAKRYEQNFYVVPPLEGSYQKQTFRQKRQWRESQQNNNLKQSKFDQSSLNQTFNILRHTGKEQQLDIDQQIQNLIVQLGVKGAVPELKTFEQKFKYKVKLQRLTDYQQLHIQLTQQLEQFSFSQDSNFLQQLVNYRQILVNLLSNACDFSQLLGYPLFPDFNDQTTPQQFQMLFTEQIYTQILTEVRFPRLQGKFQFEQNKCRILLNCELEGENVNLPQLIWFLIQKNISQEIDFKNSGKAATFADNFTTNLNTHKQLLQNKGAEGYAPITVPLSDEPEFFKTDVIIPVKKQIVKEQKPEQQSNLPSLSAFKQIEEEFIIDPELQDIEQFQTEIPDKKKKKRKNESLEEIQLADIEKSETNIKKRKKSRVENVNNDSEEVQLADMEHSQTTIKKKKNKKEHESSQMEDELSSPRRKNKSKHHEDEDIQLADMEHSQTTIKKKKTKHEEPDEETRDSQSSPRTKKKVKHHNDDELHLADIEKSQTSVNPKKSKSRKQNESEIELKAPKKNDLDEIELSDSPPRNISNMSKEQNYKQNITPQRKQSVGRVNNESTESHRSTSSKKSSAFKQVNISANQDIFGNEIPKKKVMNDLFEEPKTSSRRRDSDKPPIADMQQTKTLAPKSKKSKTQKEDDVFSD